MRRPPRSPRFPDTPLFRSNPALAPGSTKLDCFAEPVNGRRFAPTRWLAITVEDRLRCLKIESEDIIAIAARTTSQRKACRHPPDGRPRSGAQQTAAAVTPRNAYRTMMDRRGAETPNDRLPDLPAPLATAALGHPHPPAPPPA